MTIVFPSDFIEAFEARTHQEFNHEAARAIIHIMSETSGGRCLMAQMLLPHFMRFLEEEKSKKIEYPRSPMVAVWLTSEPAALEVL